MWLAVPAGAALQSRVPQVQQHWLSRKLDLHAHTPAALCCTVLQGTITEQVQVPKLKLRWARGREGQGVLAMHSRLDGR